MLNKKPTMTPTIQLTTIKLISLELINVTLDKLRIDDPVGAISVHGTVGVFGIFAVLLSDSDATFMGQLVGTLTIFGWVFGTSLVAWIAIKAVMGIRVSAEEEEEGLDIIDCGMEAYPEFVNQ